MFYTQSIGLPATQKDIVDRVALEAAIIESIETIAVPTNNSIRKNAISILKTVLDQGFNTIEKTFTQSPTRARSTVESYAYLMDQIV